MKNFSLKALGAFIFAAGLVVAGVAAPAQAAAPIASPTDIVVAGSTNSTATTVTFDVPAGANFISLQGGSSIGVIFAGGNSNPPASQTFGTIAAYCESSGTLVKIAANPAFSANGDCSVGIMGLALYLPNAYTGTITVELEPGALSFSSNPSSGGWGLSAAVKQAGQTIAGYGSSIALTTGSPAPTTPSATLTLGASTGQLVAGSSVAIVASGLQTTAPFTVVVESTPQTIGSGNAASGAVNTSVTLPAGLEAGWHTLTFSSTAADGSALTSVTYFKVSASGTLLATATTIPAELANTGVDSANATWLLAGGLSLALIGAEMFIIARRKRSN